MRQTTGWSREQLAGGVVSVEPEAGESRTGALKKGEGSCDLNPFSVGSYARVAASLAAPGPTGCTFH